MQIPTDPVAIQLDRRGVITRPYMTFTQFCDENHMHVRGGYVSTDEVMPWEDWSDEKILVHGGTGEIFRTVVELVLSLN